MELDKGWYWQKKKTIAIINILLVYQKAGILSRLVMSVHFGLLLAILWAACKPER